MDEFLLNILVCTSCKGPLRYENETLQCGKCGICYEVNDGVPDMSIPAPPASLENGENDD